MSRPFLAITIGDPAGIGPVLGARAAGSAELRGACRPVLVGDASVVRSVCPSRAARVHPLADLDEYRDSPRILNVLHVPHPDIRRLRMGRPQRTGGESAALAIRTAVALALQRRVAAVVTGPVSKGSLRMAGLPYAGHTEMLAALCGVRRVEMLMAADRLMALLVTRHIPLSKVPASLSMSRLFSTIRLVDRWLKERGLAARPRWGVCGLNPHAGDGGLLGREEERVVAPALRKLRSAGLSLEGPLPADAAWAAHAGGHYTLLACLYHDQAMVPLKSLFPRRVVNITAGLPFARTSPGHGTAYDLAATARGRALADPAATLEAARWALRLARTL
jgi:4-hydroxythreonine-4-phosphate dehydrogenase